MVKEDCFAYKKEKEECNALRRLYCYRGECKFYKNRERIKEEQEKIHIKIK